MLEDYESKEKEKDSDKFVLKKFELDSDQSQETIMSMASSKKFVFSLTRNNSIFCIESKSLKTINGIYPLPEPKDKNNFKEKNFNKIWADREGNHCIIRNNNSIYYFNSAFKQAYELNNFKGKEICAVGLDDRNTEIKTTKKFLAVDYNNTIYECCIELEEDKLTKKKKIHDRIEPLITIYLSEPGSENDYERNSELIDDRIYGIKFIKGINSILSPNNGYYIIAVTKNRLFEFKGNDFRHIFTKYGKNPSLLNDCCKYFPSQKKQFKVEFDISYKNEPILISDKESIKMDIFNQFGWVTDTGFCFGDFKSSNTTGLPLEIKEFTVTPFQRITNKGTKELNKEPISIMHTFYHIFLLYDNCLTIISKLTSNIIYTKFLDIKFKYMIYNEYSEKNGNIFLGSENGLYQISLQNENDEIWQEFFEVGLYDEAEKNCHEKKTIKKIKRVYAENSFQKNTVGDRVMAANNYALSDEKFEIICLKYIKEGDLESLKYFLKMYKSLNFKDENESAQKKDALKNLQLNLINTWDVELFLNDNETELKEFKKLIRSIKDIDQDLIYQMLNNYGKTIEFEVYCQILGNYKLIVNRKISQGQIEQALKILIDVSSYIEDAEQNKDLLQLLGNLFLDNSHLFFQKSPIESFSFLINILIKFNVNVKNIIENAVVALMNRTDKDISKAKYLISTEKDINKKLKEKNISIKEKERLDNLRKKIEEEKEQFCKEINAILKNIEILKKSTGFKKNIKDQIKLQLNNLNNLYVFYLTLNPGDKKTIIKYLKDYCKLDSNGKKKKVEFRLDYIKAISQENKLVHSLVLTLMGKYTEAISFLFSKESNETQEACEENEEMAEFIAKNCPDKKLQKNLWIQIFINQREKEDISANNINSEEKISKVLEIMEKSKVLKIDDVLPYITDSIKIEEFKSHLSECISQYEIKINKLKEDINDYNNNVEHIIYDINKINKSSIEIKYTEIKCEICGMPVTNKRIFLFPCGHIFDMNCIRQRLLFYENTGLDYLHEDNLIIDELFYKVGLIPKPYFKENELKSSTIMLNSKSKMKFEKTEKKEDTKKKKAGLFSKISKDFNFKGKKDKISNEIDLRNNELKSLYDLLNKQCVLCGNFLIDGVQCSLKEKGAQEPNFDL